MSLNLATIRKSLAAGGGALFTGLAGALQADNWNFHLLTSQQMFPVLTFAISSAVAVFAISNRYAPVVAEVVQVAAQAGAVVLASKVVQPLADLADTLDASLAAMQDALDAAAAQGVPPEGPDLVGVGAHAADPAG